MMQNAVAYLCEIAPMAKLNCAPFSIIYILYTAVTNAENFYGGGFIHQHMMVISIWCVLFVTS